MCYYNGTRVSKAEFIRLKGIEKDIRDLDLCRPVQSGFDYQDWPIIKPVAGGADFDIQFAHWEFIPSWITNHDQLTAHRKKYTTMNAKAENILESKMFRDAALKRRCLVLSSGFYEWRHYKPAGVKKDLTYPYYITVDSDQELFFMAGIWQPWVDKETGVTFDAFAIVTTEANDLMAEVHNKKKRMPTILPEDLAGEWIQDGLSEQRIKELAAYKFPTDKMHAHTIAKDFRTQFEPVAPFDYPDLPPLSV